MLESPALLPLAAAELLSTPIIGLFLYKWIVLQMCCGGCLLFRVMLLRVMCVVECVTRSF